MVIKTSGPNSKNKRACSNITPNIIQESDHCIRQQDIDIEALKVLFRLRDAGFSGYLVGGGVRDLYLGKKPKDFDISTNARPGQLRRLFRNSRTIGRRFRLVQVFFRGGNIVEVSTLRSLSEFDINNKTEVLPSNNSFGTLEEDAFRRDLTINSLFYEIENNTIIDYVGGVDDLDNGIIKIVGKPDLRVTRDPVRIMRAIRHAARNSFKIEEESWSSIKKNISKLSLCPSSRIRDEFLKDIRGGAASSWLEISLSSGLFSTLFPFYEEYLLEDDQNGIKYELKAIFQVIDRCYQNEIPEGNLAISDHVLFAMILFPWAFRRFGLTPKKLKGPLYHDLLKQIRGELDKVFTQRLNIKRLIKESIATLWIHYPSLQLYDNGASIPKWLKKKSYFVECSRFLSLIREASGGKVTDLTGFVEIKVPPAEILSSEPISGKSKSRGRGNTMPAFSSDERGVFGLQHQQDSKINS